MNLRKFRKHSPDDAGFSYKTKTKIGREKTKNATADVSSLRRNSICNARGVRTGHHVASNANTGKMANKVRTDRLSVHMTEEVFFVTLFVY